MGHFKKHILVFFILAFVTIKGFGQSYFRGEMFCNTFRPFLIDSLENESTLYLEGLNDKDSIFIKNIYKLPNLEKLSFAIWIEDEKLIKKLFENLAKLPKLKNIHIYGINEYSMIQLRDLLKNKKNIKTLKLYYAEYKPNELKTIPEFICNYDSLERLYLYSDSFKLIDKNIMKMKNIKRVHINTNYQGEVKIYKNISKTKTLEILEIVSNPPNLKHPIVYNKFPFNVNGKNKFHFFLENPYNTVPNGAIAFMMAYDELYPLDSSYSNPQINCFNRKTLKMGMLEDTLLNTLRLINVNKYFSLLELNKNKFTNQISFNSSKSYFIWEETDTFMEKHSLRYNDIKKFLIDIGQLKYIKTIDGMEINTIDSIPFEYFSNLNHINKFSVTLNMLECTQIDVDRLKKILPNARIDLQMRGSQNEKYNTIQISR